MSLVCTKTRHKNTKCSNKEGSRCFLLYTENELMKKINDPTTTKKI